MLRNTTSIFSPTVLTKCYELFIRREFANFSVTVTRAITANLQNARKFAQRYQLAMETLKGVFEGTIDRFNGVTIDSKQQPEFAENFNEKLEKSLKHWKDIKRRAIWFNVYQEHVDCLPELVKNGFNFHHARKGFVAVYKWLPDEETENIPDFCHTMVGVGGVVINDNNEILVVSDRFGLIPGSWKLPGGYVNPGEYLPDAAMREVFEETGIKTEFQSLISVRQSHGGSFSCTDIYIVLALKPSTQELVRCEREIAKVCWMPIDEYLKHPQVHETNRDFVHKTMFLKKNGIKFDFDKRTHKVLRREYILFNVEESKW